MEYCLETQNLCKTYKSTKVLHNLNMKIPRGAIYGFVGKNGAGKTTLIRLICGLQNPTAGSYSLFGVKHTNAKIYKMRKRMGAVVETPAIYQDMTAEENLKEQFRMRGIPSYEEIPKILSLVGLSHTGKKKAGKFSLGMRQRLGIAVALCGNPDFLVLDEPVNGLDPQGIIEIRELLLKLNREYQITILISSHILDELSKIATHYGFIDNGMIVQEISAKELFRICGKYWKMKVTDTKKLCTVCDAMGLEYRVHSRQEADVHGELKVTELVMALAEEGCRTLSIQEFEEGLENYYLNLVGGGRHV